LLCETIDDLQQTLYVVFDKHEIDVQTEKTMKFFTKTLYEEFLVGYSPIKHHFSKFTSLLIKEQCLEQAITVTTRGESANCHYPTSSQISDDQISSKR